MSLRKTAFPNYIKQLIFCELFSDKGVRLVYQINPISNNEVLGWGMGFSACMPLVASNENDCSKGEDTPPDTLYWLIHS